MLRLAINTASTISQVSISLLSNPPLQILGERSWQKNQAENLLPNIAEILAANKYCFGDISEIIVVKGPGTFTGLRVGVTTANTMAYLNDADLYSLTTFELFQQVASDMKIVKPEIAIFAGARGVYLKEKDVSLDEVANLVSSYPEDAVFCGDLSEAQIDLLPNFTDLTSYSLAKATNNFFLAKKPTKERIVKPFYVKDPNITKSAKTII
jgi:tRNA threonylcarbamoyl adenosine modification protein YeaZ